MLPQPPSDLAARMTRPVAVFGAGLSGQGVQSLLGALGAVGTVYDEKAGDAHRTFDAAAAAIHALVVYSPGFAPEHPWLVQARAAGCVCLGELDFASLFWTRDLVAVTGTNGKTTLTEFLAHALNAAGRRAAVTGNIGYPLSRLVVEHRAGTEVAVCEVSSFQAETLEHLRPTATLWTNFAEDHLERHAGMPAYFSAKWRLVERTPAQRVLAGSSVAAFASTMGLSLPSAPVATENRPADPRLRSSVFERYPQRENFLLAAAWWHRTGLPEETLYEAAQTFRVGAHRLARVGEKGGVTFWNDSKATNFHAVEAALAGLGTPVLWIGGGRSKGGDIAGFVRRIAGRIRRAFLIGETAPQLAEACRGLGVPCELSRDLGAAVRAAFAISHSGDHIVLSPGFASFDMFRGYDDRGRQFENLVENL